MHVMPFNFEHHHSRACETLTILYVRYIFLLFFFSNLRILFFKLFFTSQCLSCTSCVAYCKLLSTEKERPNIKNWTWIIVCDLHPVCFSSCMGVLSTSTRRLSVGKTILFGTLRAFSSCCDLTAYIRSRFGAYIPVSSLRISYCSILCGFATHPELYWRIHYQWTAFKFANTSFQAWPYHGFQSAQRTPTRRHVGLLIGYVHVQRTWSVTMCVWLSHCLRNVEHFLQEDHMYVVAQLLTTNSTNWAAWASSLFIIDLIIH
jgi:hypothetical protein